jgi:hypothetical protein
MEIMENETIVFLPGNKYNVYARTARALLSGEHAFEQ